MLSVRDDENDNDDDCRQRQAQQGGCCWIARAAADRNEGAAAAAFDGDGLDRFVPLPDPTRRWPGFLVDDGGDDDDRDVAGTGSPRRRLRRRRKWIEETYRRASEAMERLDDDFDECDQKDESAAYSLDDVAVAVRCYRQLTDLDYCRDENDGGGGGGAADLEEGQPQALTPPPATAQQSLLPLSGSEYRLIAYACVNLGILLLTQRNWFRNDREAVALFKRAAIEFCLPSGMFLYGLSHIEGFGGIRSDAPIGVALLNEAGASGRIGEAYFVLGSLYERGNGGLPKDIVRATEMYVAAGQVYGSRPNANNSGVGEKQNRSGGDSKESTRSGAHRWKPEIRTVKMLLDFEDWQSLEQELSSLVGERLSWSLAGQAFLFGAAAALTTVVQPEHYPTLLPVLPVLGILLAVFSAVQSFETNVRNYCRCRPILKMVRAKLRAYERIIDAAAGDRVESDAAGGGRSCNAAAAVPASHCQVQKERASLRRTRRWDVSEFWSPSSARDGDCCDFYHVKIFKRSSLMVPLRSHYFRLP